MVCHGLGGTSVCNRGSRGWLGLSTWHTLQDLVICSISLGLSRIQTCVLLTLSFLPLYDWHEASLKYLLVTLAGL